MSKPALDMYTLYIIYIHMPYMYVYILYAIYTVLYCLPFPQSGNTENYPNDCVLKKQNKTKQKPVTVIP